MLSAHERAPRATATRPDPTRRPVETSAGSTGVRTDWRVRYGRIVLVGDLAVLLIAVAVAHIARFGATHEPRVGSAQVPYLMLGGVVAGLWIASLQLHQVRSPRILGHGPEEYRRVVVATFRAFALIAVLSLAFKIDVSRMYLAAVFSVGLVTLLVERKVMRRRLHRNRAHGKAVDHVLVVGGERSAAQIAAWFSKHPLAGYEVCGVWVPDDSLALSPTADGVAQRVPMMSSDVDFSEALANSGASTVMVTDTEHLGHESLRDLTWQLEGTGIDLLISPNVVDVSSSRLHLHDLSGMPMLQVSEPQYEGASRLGKSIFDRAGALILIVFLSPVLIATVAAIKLSSPGPVFFRQERVGRNQQSFRMTKFRSMVVDAETSLISLRSRNEADAVLFKMRRDPRVTSVGKFLRRFSIDELPQLFDVLRGEMSLVGPRPALPSEVEQYSERMHRRMYVRPGMTGLWQVSGRSDLSFEEAERLDLAYVDNWSITSDLMIMLRTVRAVTRGHGAY